MDLCVSLEYNPDSQREYISTPKAPDDIEAGDMLPDSPDSDLSPDVTDTAPQEKVKGLSLTLPKSALENGGLETAPSHVFLLRLRDLNLGDEQGSRDAKSFYAKDSELSSGAVVRRPVFMKDEPEVEKLGKKEKEDSEILREALENLDQPLNCVDDDADERNLKDLPEDILQLCFAKVPYSFHPRLRAVCKQWYDLADGQRLLQVMIFSLICCPFSCLHVFSFFLSFLPFFVVSMQIECIVINCQFALLSVKKAR